MYSRTEVEWRRRQLRGSSPEGVRRLQPRNPRPADRSPGAALFRLIGAQGRLSPSGVLRVRRQRRRRRRVGDHIEPASRRTAKRKAKKRRQKVVAGRAREIFSDVYFDEEENGAGG